LTIILHRSLVLEEEKKSGFYSPQFDPDTCESQAKFGHSCSPSSSSMINSVSTFCNVGNFESTEQPRSTAHEGEPEFTGTPVEEKASPQGEPEITRTPVEEKASPQDNLDMQHKLSVADVMCTMCKQLLFHPVVLNCGHGNQCILSLLSNFKYIFSKLSLLEHLTDIVFVLLSCCSLKYTVKLVSTS
jgi:hypothetical protein